MVRTCLPRRLSRRASLRLGSGGRYCDRTHRLPAVKMELKQPVEVLARIFQGHRCLPCRGLRRPSWVMSSPHTPDDGGGSGVATLARRNVGDGGVSQPPTNSISRSSLPHSPKSFAISRIELSPHVISPLSLWLYTTRPCRMRSGCGGLEIPSAASSLNRRQFKT